MSRLRILFSINSSYSILVQTSTRFKKINGLLTVPSSSISSSTSIMIRRISGMWSSYAVQASSPPPEENGFEKENYENAIKTLNTLQSNAATIAKARLNRDHRRSTSIPYTLTALTESGLSLDAIDNLDIVHVAGTKGKGMTCAYTESILRQAGLKTGFFSSPHLTAVRERIRIDGVPISEHRFAQTFFTVYKKLEHLKSQDDGELMPHYFRFLMIMAFHIFLEEKVDAVILEVGIGGKFDTTNFIRKPTVIGISSLGLEHQYVLGHSLEEIALQKAGIMKTGIPAYTVHTHPPQIASILREHAKEVDCPINFLEPLNFGGIGVGIELGVDDGEGGVAGINAGLAINLANELLLKRHSHIFPRLSGMVTCAKDLQYSREVAMFLPFQIRGLQLCKWDGRFQKIQDLQHKKIIYFLDGAHTLDSLNVTLQWFNRQCSSHRSLRLLVFNITGERNCEEMMAPLVSAEIFDLAIFCPLVASIDSSKNSSKKSSPDNWSALNDGEDPLEGCKKLARIWEDVQQRSKGVVLQSAEETLEYIQELAVGEQLRIQVLVTGSLHLVGTFLTVLQPNRNDE